MGGSPATATSTSKSGSAMRWAKPYAKAAVGDVNSVYSAAAPGLQKLTSTVQNDLMPAKVGQYNAGMGNVQAGNAFLGDVLGGKYLSQGNPYMQGVIDNTAHDIRNNVASSFAQAGRYGSVAHQDALAKEIGNMSLGARYQNYGDEMTRIGQAAQLAQANSSTDYQQALAGAGVGAELPYTGTNALANQLAALFQGSKSTSTQTGAKMGLLDYAMQGASNAAAAYGASGSDRRMKQDIVKVGEMPDGLGVYEWTYKADATGKRWVGVMADEVKELRPHAYIPNFAGEMAGVNYDVL